MTAFKKDVDLFFPPLWNPLQAPLGIPTLYKYLKDKGFHASQYDLNIEFIHHMLSKEWLSKKSKYIEEKIKDLLNEDKLSSSKRGEYFRLSAALSGLQKAMQIMPSSLQGLRQPESFFSLEQYLSFHERIDETLFFISQCYEDVFLSEIHYKSGFSEFSSSDIVRSMNDELRKSKNLFYDFFSGNILNEIIERNRPLLAAISLLDTEQVLAAFSIAKIIRELSPETKIVFGGPLISKWLFISKEDLFNMDLVDFFVTHEGCVALENLILALKSRKSFDEVPNLYHVSGGKLLAPKTLKPFVGQFYFPDFEGMNLSRYFTPRPVIPIKSSNGCFWGKCVFCEHTFLAVQEDQGHNQVSAEGLLGEMKELSLKYDSSLFTFTDSCIPFEFIEEFCEGIIADRLPFKWSCFLRLDEGLNGKLIRKLKQAGCMKIYTGYESASERIIFNMKKRSGSVDLFHIFRNLFENKISLGLFVMFGFLDESEEEMSQTFEMMKSLKSYLMLPGFTFEFIPFSLRKCSPIFGDPAGFKIRSMIAPTGDLEIESGYEMDDEDCSSNSEKRWELYFHWAKKYDELFREFPFVRYKNRITLDVHDAMNILYLDRYGTSFHSFPSFPARKFSCRIRRNFFPRKITNSHLSIPPWVVLLRIPFLPDDLDENDSHFNPRNPKDEPKHLAYHAKNNFWEEVDADTYYTLTEIQQLVDSHSSQILKQKGKSTISSINHLISIGLLNSTPEAPL